MKLQTGANQVSNALNYNASSKQFSNKLVTRKFTMNPATMKRTSMTDMEEMGYMGSKIDLIGGAEMLEDDNLKAPNLSKESSSGLKLSNDPFTFMAGKNSRKMSSHGSRQRRKMPVFKTGNSSSHNPSSKKSSSLHSGGSNDIFKAL